MVRIAIEYRPLSGWQRQAQACRWPNPMMVPRGQGLLALALSLFVVMSPFSTVWARYSSPTTGPAGRGTLPPSSYQTSLVNLPNPVDNTSNLVITGNVSGGKAFRGNIPYGSATSFGGRLGSTSLDPFLRYSAIPEDLSAGSSAYSPFYSPTGTVPKIQPGSSSVFAPGSPRVAVGMMASQAEQPADVMPLAEAAPSRAATGPMASGRLGDSPSPSWGRFQASLEGTVPMWSKAPEEMRRIVAGESGSPSTERQLTPQSRQTLTPEEYRQQLEQLQRDLDRVKANASQFEQDLRVGRQTPSQSMEQQPVEAAQPYASAETLRRIIQPESQAQPPAANPPAGQDLLSRTMSTPDGWGTPGQIATGRSELALVSPQGPPAGQPLSPEPSPSELAAQKSRIDGIFAPQTGGTVPETGRAEPRGASSSKLPALQRVEETARAFDAPGRALTYPLQNSAGNVPASAAGGVAGPPTGSVASVVQPAPAPSLSTDTDAALRYTRGVEDALPPSPSRPPAAAQTSQAALGGLGATQPNQTQVQSARPPAPPPADGINPAKGASDSVSKEQFDRCLTSADADMRQGRYARAAESYALACLYKPKEARPQIGRSHALFAAGDYLGSAVCLSKAIELDSHYVLKKPGKKSDFIEAVGGPDRFVQRITELEQSARNNNAPGLQMLLAYVYQQVDRPEEARTAIRFARKALPSSMPVALLEVAISGGIPSG